MHEGTGVEDMQTETQSGFKTVDVRPIEEARRERARVVASMAEYLAPDVEAHPERASDAVASLAEWSDGDREILAKARADVIRDTAAMQETTREAARLLRRVESTS
jgi:hypothetical protein